MQLLLSLFFSLNSWAITTPINENPLTARMSVYPSSVEAGANIEVLIQMELADDHHAYLDKFQAKLSADQMGKLSQFQITPIIEFFDPISKQMKRGVTGRAEMHMVFEVPEELPQAKNILKIDLTYQACKKEYCLFPKTLKLEIPYIAIPPAKPAGAGGSLQSRLQSSFQEAMSGNLFLALVVVFFAGILTSFTPCIFPLIPITLAVLGVRSSANRRRRHGFFMALAYVFGIATTYSLLGVVAASSGMLFGSFLSHPIVAIIFATLFLVMSLSLLGYFDIQVPHFLTKKLTKHKAKSSFAGVYIAGMIAGVIASPCVGPVLVSILAVVAQSGKIFLGFLLLFVFALGMGQLFLLLGTFHQSNKWLPKSGGWMEFVKWIFGIILLLLAFYYLNPVLSAQVFINTTITVFAVLSMLLLLKPPLGILRSHIGSRFALVGLIGLSLLGFSKTIRGNDLFMTTSESYTKLPWKSYSADALEEARKSGKAILIDFYADWCVACKELEMYTFSNSKIQELSGRFIFLKYDATNDSAEFQQIKKTYTILGLPHLVFYDSSGAYRSDLTLTGFETAEPFAERMQNALRPAQ